MLKFTNIYIHTDGSKHQRTVETDQVCTDIIVQMVAELMELERSDSEDDEVDLGTDDEYADEDEIEREFVKQLINEDPFEELERRVEHLEMIAASKHLKIKDK